MAIFTAGQEATLARVGDEWDALSAAQVKDVEAYLARESGTNERARM